MAFAAIDFGNTSFNLTVQIQDYSKFLFIFFMGTGM